MKFYNATQINHFDVTELWNITQSIKAFNPLDPRLFYPIKDNILDRSRTLLTYKGCVDLIASGNDWAYYDINDVWQRVQLWKLPLLQLIAQMQLPPLGWRANIFVFLHMIADPIDTIWSLSYKIYLCHSYAERWSSDEDWKALGMIAVSYDEWGEGNAAAETLSEALNGHGKYIEHGETLTKHISPDQCKSVRKACLQVGQSLSADRSTSFIPVTVALVIFMAAIGTAFDKNASKPVRLSNNVATHSIAFTALCFAVVPAVFLSAIVGVSQQRGTIPHHLSRLHTDVKESTILPRHSGYWKRRTSGGIYSWQPRKWESLKPGIGSWHPRVNAVLSFSTVIVGGIVAIYMSYSVPPVGFGCREIKSIVSVLMWILSAIIDVWVARKAFSQKTSFTIIFAKDLLCTIAILLENIYAHIGIFNRCSCWTNFGYGPLCFAVEPKVAEEIHQKAGRQWAIALGCLVGWEVIVFVVVCLLSHKGVNMLLSSNNNEVERNDDDDSDDDSDKEQIGWRHISPGLQIIQRIWRGIMRSGKTDETMSHSSVELLRPHRIPTIAFDNDRVPLWS